MRKKTFLFPEIPEEQKGFSIGFFRQRRLAALYIICLQIFNQ